MKSAIRSAAVVTAAAAALTGAVAAPANAATVNKVLQYSCNFALMPNMPNESALLSFAGTFADTAQAGVGTAPVNITSKLSFSQTTGTGLAAAGAATVQFGGPIKINVIQPGSIVPLNINHSFPAVGVSSGTVLSQTGTGTIPSLTFSAAGTVSYLLSDFTLTATLRNSSNATIGTTSVRCTRKANQDSLITQTVVS
ncbi:DUF6801 domain-containing protein [Thermomonospora umbrina]|uniref:DUF6801 domain-containing protein n=1 Tax=Thermomonospora umbrina TaxID=111806 RepID=A0A3D9SL29_9ACTN|nr:DUF6801 domain-containing protein [Thermomonospora umbrina]REE96417.1 hypothetical protein DFJ69_1853 [Thermomonospora umbrina]